MYCCTFHGQRISIHISKWVQQTKKSNIQKARKFANTFRFIDDFCAINNSSEFEYNLEEIYPINLELVLKKTKYFKSESFLP